MIKQTPENYLANILEGYANSLRKGWIPIDGIYGNLLLILTSEGYLEKKKEVYERRLQ